MDSFFFGLKEYEIKLNKYSLNANNYNKWTLFFIKMCKERRDEEVMNILEIIRRKTANLTVSFNEVVDEWLLYKKMTNGQY